MLRQDAVFRYAELAGEAENSRLVLSGRVGVIAPPTCVKRLLFARQATRFPMETHPTELGAFLVRGQGRVRIYVASSETVGVKVREVVTARVRADVERGMRLVVFVHNHPFLFDRRVGDRTWTTPTTVDDVAGALAPSLTDVQLFRALSAELKPEGAWITNGFDSAHYRQDDFGVLRARE